MDARLSSHFKECASTINGVFSKLFFLIGSNEIAVQSNTECFDRIVRDPKNYSVKVLCFACETMGLMMTSQLLVMGKEDFICVVVFFILRKLH